MSVEMGAYSINRLEGLNRGLTVGRYVFVQDVRLKLIKKI